MNLYEAKWWFVTLCFFLLGALWAYIIMFTWGTLFFYPYLVTGLITAAVGLTFGRTARLIWDTTQPRAWKVRVR